MLGYNHTAANFELSNLKYQRVSFLEKMKHVLYLMQAIADFNALLYCHLPLS